MLLIMFWSELVDVLFVVLSVVFTLGMICCGFGGDLAASAYVIGYVAICFSSPFHYFKGAVFIVCSNHIL